MATKRPATRARSIPCTLIHTKSGNQFTIFEDQEFTIGRSNDNLGVINRPYMSECHSVIKCVDELYYICDLDSSTGTFLNYESLDAEKNKIKELHNGDLISFGNTSKGADCVFKFCCPPNLNKRQKSDMKKLEKASLKMKDYKTNYKKNLSILHNKISSIKSDHTALNKDIRLQMAEFETLINKAKKQTVIFDEKRRTIFSQQLADSAVKSLEAADFKNKVLDLIESELQCSICNEAVIKARVTNCRHSFCESCFLEWMVLNPQCPVCRDAIQFSVGCFTMDNFIKSYYDYIGGTPKAIRDELVKNTTKGYKSRKEHVNAMAYMSILGNGSREENDMVDLTNDE